MNRMELAERVAQDTGSTRSEAENAIKAACDAIGDALCNGGEVRIAGFGTFGSKERAAREGRNPRTGETVQIAASRSAAFKPAKALKDKLNA